MSDADLEDPVTVDGPVAVVLAGGGARGAYEVGALSVLLPELDRRGERPTIFVGNSVGAVNATYLAANAHRPAGDVIADGQRIWREVTITNLVRHLWAPGMVWRLLAYVGEVLGVPRARLWSLLDTAPLKGPIASIVDFEQLRHNVADGVVDTTAVLATSMLTRRTVVFHLGGNSPLKDPRRLIDYIATPDLEVQHVRASAAIPAVFPAAEVTDPPGAKGWYVDGGTRLNTPVKPALRLGARAVVVVALTSVSSGPPDVAGPERPDALAGVGQIVYGLLADPLVQDVHTLASVNQDVRAGGPRRTVPYILISPDKPDGIEQEAHRIFRERYRGLRGLIRSPDLALVGRLTGAGVTPYDTT